jgi:cytochrome d ubiquinol oxidase subunit I
MTLATSALELARWQFAITTLFHFTFVPLTLGLGPLLLILQTRWYRTRDVRWLRLTKFFGALFLINFAIGAATGLVQEFQFGMNWSHFSAYVGDVFGAPLALEAFGAFFLESTFIGLWIFGWKKLSPKVHLASLYGVVIGTWLSAYFIVAANSWMQHPVGYVINSAGRAQATNMWEVLTQRFAIVAFVHVLLAGLMVGAFLMLGVASWHLLKGRNVDLMSSAAKLAILVALPVSVIQLGWGSEFGVEVTKAQPMKIASVEAQWETETRAPFSLFQIGGFTAEDPDPSFEVAIPGLLSFLATNDINGTVVGMNENQANEAAQFGPGDYMPNIRMSYISMRVMAYLGSLSAALAAWGAWLLWRRRTLAGSRWFQRAAILGIALPFLSAFAGWVLTEAGRQPWVVWGLLKTENANSPSVGTASVVSSLAVLITLYIGLGVLDFVLMRRHAQLDPPELQENGDAPEVDVPQPVLEY